jgi:hypothetical protein
MPLRSKSILKPIRPYAFPSVMDGRRSGIITRKPEQSGMSDLFFL